MERNVETNRSILEKLFRRKPVARIDTLRKVLGVRSRTTVFVVLKTAGYLTSYSHAGQYYTLRHIPTFDAQGLWFHGEVRFSKHGTLRATIVVLIKQAPAGYTHDELQALVGLRVHDTLRDLVEARQIARETVEARYVYLDVDPSTAKVQLAQRHEMQQHQKARETTSSPPLDAARVIDVLLAVIREPRASTVKVAAALREGGRGVTDAQVEEVFRRYELGKKTAPSRSRRSRR